MVGPCLPGGIDANMPDTLPTPLPDPCPHCGGACMLQVVTLTLPRSGVAFAVVRNVPAEVCQTCGETQFSIQTTGRLMGILEPARPPDDVAVVPVYDLALHHPDEVS